MAEQKLYVRGGRDMKRIEISVCLLENGTVQIKNSENVSLSIPSDNTLKATDVFKLFNNGLDVNYICNSERIIPPFGTNLNKMQIVYNDCLGLINDIKDSINGKIEANNSVANSISSSESVDVNEGERSL